MRATAIAIFTLIAAFSVGCGGGSGRKTEEAFGVDSAPSSGAAGGLQAQVLHFKQRDNYLLVNLRLTNNGTSTLILKNPGSTLIGFNAAAEGRSVSADKQGNHAYWSPWTGTVIHEGQTSDNLELPAGISTEMELKWSWRPPLAKSDYDWTITIGQIYQGEAKQADVKIAYPPASAAAPVAK